MYYAINHRATPKKATGSEKKKIPKSTFDQSSDVTKLEPSQKWKSLGLTEDTKYYTAPQTPLKPPRYKTV